MRFAVRSAGDSRISPGSIRAPPPLPPVNAAGGVRIYRGQLPGGSPLRLAGSTHPVLLMPVPNSLEPIAQEPRDAVFAHWRRAVVRFVRQRPLGAAGAGIIVLMILCALCAPRLTTYDPLEIDFTAQLTPPNAQHWLGTDAFGRDLLSRLMYGSRTALLVGFVSAFFGASLGAIIGVASAYFSGRIDLMM